MRGKVDQTDVIDTLEKGLSNIQKKASGQYRSGMAQVSGDKTILDFSDIDKAIKDGYGMATFHGKTKNEEATKLLDKAVAVIDDWKASDPKIYHTPEGIDALKQRIGGILESIPYEQKTAEKTIGGLYASIKEAIGKQAPVYRDVMKEYSDVADQLHEVKRTFSVGRGAAQDTTMRKLQSVMRNNANTNYGNRINLVKQLEDQGDVSIMPSLAGQALNSLAPRGLGKLASSGLAGYGIATTNPYTIPLLASQSPRLVGESALAIGQGARIVDNALSKLAFKMPEKIAGAGLQNTRPRMPDMSMRVLAPDDPGTYAIAKRDMPEVRDRGLLSFADDMPQKIPKHVDAIDFPLRQEVLQYPEYANVINAFTKRAEELRTIATKAISEKVRNNAKAELAQLEKEFAAGMKQFGVDSAAEAHGLNRPLYESGKPTKLPIKKSGEK
jgi:hypothetical protein